MGEWEREHEGATLRISGHTLFRGRDDRWFSLSRRGIEDGFYGDDKTDPNQVVEEQIKRADKGRELNKSVVDVPGLDGIRMHKDAVERAKVALKAGKSWHFTPAGMGTGFMVSKKKTRHASRASAALEQFLEIYGLYLERTDCD